MGPWWLARGMVVAGLLAAAPAHAGYTLYESASFTHPGEPYGYSLSEAQYLGVRFQNNSPWRVESVGGHLFQGDGTNNLLFVAIVALDGPNDLPTDLELSQPHWSTSFEAPLLSADLLIEANISLEPGWWALILGSGGALGSSGSGGMAAYQPNVGYPSFFRRRNGVWEESATRGKRFHVFGTVSCYEDTSDTAVQCNEDCFDGRDNDEDGFIDCQDEDCWHLADCCDADLDGFLRDEELCGWGPDCDDTILTGPAVFPGAGEQPNDGVDQNCDGVETCWQDADRDGFGHHQRTTLSSDMACDNEPGEAAEPTDCDDVGPAAALVHPGASEVVGDGVDQDCDGADRCFHDIDGDGYGVLPAIPGQGLDCDAVPGGSSRGGDCDEVGPLAALHHPGAAEIIADGIDQDCDGVDACYLDVDADGYGVAVVVPTSILGCDGDPHASANADDCDDRNGDGYWNHPYGVEVPGDGIDQDCDGVDACWLDEDGDGFGGPTLAAGLSLRCEEAPGLVSVGLDCLDQGAGASGVFPGAPEVPGDGLDQNCDGNDDCFYDRDRDGFGGSIVAQGVQGVCDGTPGLSSHNDDCKDTGVGAPLIHPGAVEVVADNTDQDCDGVDLCWSDDDDDGVGGVETVLGLDLACADDPTASDQTGDCDDLDPTIRPGAVEHPANGVDQDCDGQELCYADVDRDGFGTLVLVLSQVFDCRISPTGAGQAGDCDDEAAEVFPGAWEVPYDLIDQDCDGLDLVDVDGDGQLWDLVGGEDCQDNDRSVFRGAFEVANGVDDDCDGVVDESTHLFDDDLDGFTESGGDCDDDAILVFPGAPELCNGVSDDCDVHVDEGTPCADDDNDGYTEVDGDCHDGDGRINPGFAEIPGNGIDDDCDGQLWGEVGDEDFDGFTEGAGDCMPRHADVHPGAMEVGDGLDNDCDGVIDEGTHRHDDDGDGLTEDEGDCHDGDALVYPGAPELLNGVDDDCDRFVDNVGYWLDGDGDLRLGDLDCDDADPTIYLFAPELLDGIDNDCDGFVDEGVVDVDGDGWTYDEGDCNDLNGWTRPDGVEVCDAIDNDCDGLLDEGCPDALPIRVVPVVSGGCEHGGGAGWWVSVLVFGLRRRVACAGRLADAAGDGLR